MIRSLVILLLPLCLATAAHAQLTHLSPVSSASESGSETLLRIERRAPPATGQNAIDMATDLRIDNGKYYLLMPNQPVVDELGNRTLLEFVQYLNATYPGHRFSTEAPEVRVSELKEGSHPFVAGVIEIERGEGRPQVAATLGLGFIANEVRSAAGEDGSTLMRNAGIDLEVVATKPIARFTARGRVGFHSAEPVPVQQGDTAGASPPSSPTAPATPTAADPRATITGAQAVGVGLEVSYHVPLQAALGSPNQSHLAFVVEGSQYWASPSAYELPSTIVVNGQTKAIADVFSEDEIQDARDRLERIVPLTSGLAGVRLLFGRHEDPAFYLLGDVGYRQYLLRSAGSRYTVSAPPGTTPVPNPTRIGTIFERRWEPILRAGGGIRLSRAIDLKVDVAAPLGDRKFGQNAQPTLRVQLATYGVKFGT